MLKRILALVVAGGAALIVLLLIAHVAANRRVAAQLEGRIAALKKAGEPVSLPDLATKPVSAEQDAAVWLRRSKAHVDALGEQLIPLSDKPEEHYQKGRLNEAGAARVR